MKESWALDRPWLSDGVVVFWAYLAGVAATMVQFALPAVLPTVESRFGYNPAQAGWVMSLFAVATLVTALPGGMMSRQMGPRRIGAIGLFSMAAGSTLVAIALSDAAGTGFWVGRGLSGLGFGLTAVAAPAAIGRFVSPRRLPWAMAVWATWVPVGALAMFFAAPRWAYSTPSLVHFNLGLAGMAVLVGIGFVLGIPAAREAGAHARHGVLEALGWAVRRRPVVWAASSFAAFTFGVFGLNTFVTTFFVTRFGWSLVAAGNFAAAMSAAGGVGNLIAGAAWSPAPGRWSVTVAPAAAVTLLWLGYLSQAPAVVMAAALAASLIGGFIPTVVFAAPVHHARAGEEIPLLMALVIVGENAGIIGGPAIFGLWLHLTGSWTAAFLTIFVVNAWMTLGMWRLASAGPSDEALQSA